MTKRQISIPPEFFSKFHHKVFLTTAKFNLKKDFKDGLDLANKLCNTCLVNELNANVFHFVVK